MGSLGEKTILEFEDESLVSPVSLNRKNFAFEASMHGSPSSGDSQKFCYGNMKNRIIDSIKIVVFSAKINLLMPFGPLAILVSSLSGHHVSYLPTCSHQFILGCYLVPLWIHCLCMCISGVGLPFKLTGDHTSCWASGLCNGVRFLQF